MSDSTQQNFRQSLKMLLELKLNNEGVTGVTVEITRGKGNVSVRISGAESNIQQAQRVLTDYSMLIEYKAVK